MHVCFLSTPTNTAKRQLLNRVPGHSTSQGSQETQSSGWGSRNPTPTQQVILRTRQRQRPTCYPFQMSSAWGVGSAEKKTRKHLMCCLPSPCPCSTSAVEVFSFTSLLSALTFLPAIMPMRSHGDEATIHRKVPSQHCIDGYGHVAIATCAAAPCLEAWRTWTQE